MTDETYKISMALYDFVPVFCFLIGAVFCVKITRLVLDKKYRVLMTLGCVLIILGGGLQAAWKLLNASLQLDIHWMSQAQFILMAFGYLGMLFPVIRLTRERKLTISSSLPAMAMWKVPFLAVMTLSSLGVYALLGMISIRKRLWAAAAGFLVAFLMVLLMGFMASRTQTISLQWFEQSFNTLGNLGFALGSIILYRAYMKKHTS